MNSKNFKYTRATTEAEVVALIEWHNKNSEYVCIDTETTGLDRFKDTLLTIIITGYDCDHALSFDASMARYLLLLEVPKLVLQNFRFDFSILGNAGVDLRWRGAIQDTMLLDHLLDENQEHGLDAMVQRRYGDDYKQSFWETYKTFESAPEAAQLEYACKDVIYTGYIYRDTLADLRAVGINDGLIHHVHALAAELFNTEYEGIRLDFDYLMQIGTELKPKIAEAKTAMRLAGEAHIVAMEMDKYAEELNARKSDRGKARVPFPEFNWNSHAQINDLLYNRLRCTPQRKKSKSTKQFVLTSDDDALSKIETEHAVPRLLREYNTCQKVYTAFIEGTLEQAHNGRIFPSINVNGTVTGRISISDPNLQQLPASGDWARVRGIYLPDWGDLLLSCDYKQLEVVIAAHFSHDPNLLKIINEGASKHDITANGLGIERSLAKIINFAMQYGCTPQKIMQILNCSMEDAQLAWNKYWETYKEEKKVIDACRKCVDDGRPIISPWGRHRHFPKTFETRWQKEACYRQAYSALVQGTGSDCTHWAFYKYAKASRGRGLGRALFEVHDELVVSVKKETKEEAKALLEETMIQAGVAANLTLPLQVDCSDFLERWQKG